MLSDDCHDRRMFANPCIPSDGDPGPSARLFADGNVEPLDVVLATPVDDRDMRADEHIILERHSTDAAEKPNINVSADLRGRVRNDCAER